jgi:hypothetical protein
MTDLKIRLTKKRNGTTILSCLRKDGTSTWQRYQGEFFALHDLTHYAVETILEYKQGFFGLLADGWNISDFGTPWPRGPIPADADPAEIVVGLLHVEQSSRVEMSASEFNASAQGVCALSDAQLTAIRERMRELFHRWAALSPGSTMELIFPESSVS